MRNFGPRHYKPEGMNYKGHWAVGTKWVVDGSKDNVYTIEFTDRGFTCECIGLAMHGHCKHTKQISKGFLDD